MKNRKIASLIVSISFIFTLITPINSSYIESISNDIPDSIQEFIIHNYATSLKLIMSSYDSTSNIDDYTIMSPVFLIASQILQTWMVIMFTISRLQAKTAI